MAGLGCSPLSVISGKAPLLPADSLLGFAGRRDIKERRNTNAQQENYRYQMKRHFDKRRTTELPKLQVGDFVLVRKGLPGPASQFRGPYQVIKTAVQQGFLKAMSYTGPNKTGEVAPITNVFKYHSRRNEFTSRGE